MSKLDSDRMVYLVNELHGEDDYWKHKVLRTGIAIRHGVIIPRIHHELTYKKRDDAFRRMCWGLRSNYRSTLTFNWTP